MPRLTVCLEMRGERLTERVRTPKCSHTRNVVSVPNLSFLNSLFLVFHGLVDVEF
jgi:hypothetical protein